jgi:hypothetical protein
MLLADDSSHQQVTDLIASVVTRKRGECLIRLGLHPPHDLLFPSTQALKEPEPTENADGWIGERLTEEQLTTVLARLNDVVDAFGGKVTRLYENSRRALCLVRIPPPSVELTPEVRCAVVGK